ncbi:MAG TPA: TetR/AcrR family transcriptional regulator [Clostridiales bacterium]|nr:TetR/AcrR family transcriptional regulator [Clostridiales bacterium]
MSDIKELLIDQTIALINESDGRPDSITARAIAQRSGVALGLINYHFGSKDDLLAQCSDKIIKELLSGMKPGLMNAADDGLSDRERLTEYAKQTFEYLFANRAIVKMSILSDFRSYGADSNSALTQKGFQMALRGNIPDERKRLIAFSLASSMQTAFLAADESKEITGYDLKTGRGRSSFIEDTVTMLMGEVI